MMGMDRMVHVLGRFLGLEAVERAENRLVVKASLLIAVVAMVLRVVFWIYTQRYWEDALITCLHSENVFRGLGLTHITSAGNPLHGFTSPLSVLVPLLGDAIHIGFGVEFLKLVSIPASALCVFYVLGLGIHPKVRLASPLIVLAMGYVAVEHHQILWGMAGMETQLVVLAVLMSLYYTVSLQTIPLGLSLGLCMLARPDLAFWTVISGVYVLLVAPRSFLKVVAMALVVYLPWIAFTTGYYGSPIPHTIHAKGAGFGLPWLAAENFGFFSIKRHTWMTLSEQLYIYLGPTFGGHGAGIHKFFTSGPESPIANGMFFFAVVGTVWLLVKRSWALWPLAAFVVVYSVYYVYLVPIIYGWYKVPYAAVMLLLSLWGVHCLARFIPAPRWRNRALSLFSIIYLGLFIVVLPQTFYAEHMIQEHVENSVRKKAALFLKEQMGPDDVVGAEALGYLSYYSQHKVYDWPGLASRDVLAWSQSQPPEARNLENMCKGLEPDYLFLRDLEVLYHFKSDAWLHEKYHVIGVFEVDPAIKHEIPWIERSVDLLFRVYKRNEPDDPRPYDDELFPKRPVAP